VKTNPCQQLDAMQTTQRVEPEVGDVNEEKNEEVEVEEVVAEDAAEDLMLREVVKLGSRVNIGILMYKGNLEIE
jgi:hypothetical protein